MSSKFLAELISALKYANTVFADGFLILDGHMQYQLFTVLNLTQRFLKALEKLDINLNEIEDEQEKISQFYHLVSKIVERFLEQDEEEKYENENT